MNFIGVGPQEAFLVLVITILVVGPHRFPEIARQTAKYVRIARRYATVVTADVRGAMDEIEREATELRSEFDEERGEQLRAVREVGEEFTSSVRETEKELRVVRAEAGSAAREGSAAASGAVDQARTSEPLVAPRELHTPATKAEPDSSETPEPASVDIGRDTGA